MANGKDAMKYVLSTISFSSITFLDKDIQNYWNDVIPEIIDLQTNENIENPAQRVELLFANETYSDEGSNPKIINTKLIDFSNLESVLGGSQAPLGFWTGPSWSELGFETAA